MTVAWLNPAGGLRYHARGFRYAKSLWYGFRFALAEWLYAWQPPERRLVIVGPSAGYCFQPFFFERFDELVCIEPDPVARRLFAYRLGRAPLEHRPKLSFEAHDLLLDDPARFAERLEREGDVAVLFSNIVGQFRVLLEVQDANDPRLARLRAELLPAVGARSWASFHDRVSGGVEPFLEGGFRSERRLGDAEVLERFYPDSDPVEAMISPRGDTPLIDHLTAGFFPPDLPHAYFAWPLLPGVFHLIEATGRARVG